MAVALVNKKQTGSAATGALTFVTPPVKGNVLVAFISQTGTEAAPTLSAGWVVNATSALSTAAAVKLFVAIKEATGADGERIEPSPGAGGVIQGISYTEWSGLTTEVDVIVATNGRPKAATATTEPVTTPTAGCAVLTGWGRGPAASGTVGSWTGEGPLENVETATTRCFSGFKVFAGKLTAATFTANWATEAVSGLLTVALKPAVEAATGHVVTVI